MIRPEQGFILIHTRKIVGLCVLHHDDEQRRTYVALRLNTPLE